MKCSPTQTPDDIDLPALRERYKFERERRVRANGVQQYVEVTKDLSEYYEADPYAPAVSRAPISTETEVAILGGGFSGLIAVRRLKEAGVSDLRIIEMGGDFGGTWYWNRYPGVQCDIESYTYFPFLEELGYVPKEKYSYGPEIYAHCQRVGRHFGLYERALFGTIVRALRWDPAIKRWHVSTNHGDDIRARFVVMAAGFLNKPKLPGIPGLSDFKGHTFHTARWDYDYTGGDTTGGLTKLGDKRVGIIGTGATAIQCVPFLGKYAKHLYVFQRTPSYVDERRNKPTDPEWAKSLKPGWQAVRQANHQAGIFEGFRSPDDDLICDGWSEVYRNLTAKLNAMGNPQLDLAKLMEMHELEDYKAMERIRRRVDSVVKDKATAELLKPWYRFLCKRPCFNDDYLPTFNRPNVTLVDVSASKGVERITPHGLVANGVEYPVDCIVYASGFENTTNLKRRFGIDAIEGRDGLSLYDHWADGFRTLHGLMAHGFPNLFFTGYVQGAITVSVNLMYDQQGGHIAQVIKKTLARRAITAEPTQEAQDGWVETVRTTAISTAPFLQQCTPGYYNNEGGEITRAGFYGEVYGPGFNAFDRVLKDWLSKGMEGLVLGT